MYSPDAITNMKKLVYIVAFAGLGFLVQLLVHVGVEMLVIYLLTKDFATYGLGLSWDTWFMIHAAGGTLLALIGVIVGVQQGFYWYRRVYGK